MPLDASDEAIFKAFQRAEQAGDTKAARALIGELARRRGRTKEPVQTGRPKSMPTPEPVERITGQPGKSPGRATIEPFTGPGQRPGIRTDEGAPFSVREVVGAPRRKAEDRLATMRKFFPDAQPMGDDNFVFTDPNTGQRRIFNPKGMDVGDIATYGREVVQFGAGGLGAAAGAAAGPAGSALGAGLGSEAAGQLYDALRKRFGGMVDTRTLKEMALEGAVNIGTEAAGQGIGEAIAKVPGKLRQFIQRDVAGRGPEAASRLARMQEAGIPIEGAAPAVSQSRPVMLASEQLANLPGSARTMERATAKTLDAVEGQIDDVLTRMGGEMTQAAGGPLSKEAAGEAVKKAAKAGAEKFSARAGQLVDDLNQQMVGVRVRPDNVFRAVAELQAELAEAPGVRQYLRAGLNEASRLLDDLGRAQDVPFKALTDLRTDLRGKLLRPDVSGYLDKEGQAVQKIRSALKDDIIEGAVRQGPDTARARAIRDRYIRMMREERIPLLNEIDKRNAQDIVDFAMRNTKKGAEYLRQFKKTLDPSTYRDLSATALRELGRRGGDEFDTSLFLRGYSRLSDEARSELFSGANVGPLKKELDRLTKIVGDLDKVKEIRNFSKTAMNNYYMQLLGGLGIGSISYGVTQDPSMGAAGFGAAVLGPNALSKLMTSPKFVRWLGTAIQEPSKSLIKAGGHLGRLGAIAEAEPYIAEELKAFVEAIKQNPPPQMQENQ